MSQTCFNASSTSWIRGCCSFELPSGSLPSVILSFLPNSAMACSNKWPSSLSFCTTTVFMKAGTDEGRAPQAIESLSCNQSSPGARSKEQLAKPTSLESHSSTDQIRVFLRVSLIQTSLKFFLKISRGLFYKRVSRFALEFLKRSFVPKRVLGFSLECKVYLRYYDRLRRLFVSNTINS